MASSLVLLLGPSGVGKSTVIRALCASDPRFSYVRPYTTRPLRAGETEKVHVSEEEMDSLDAAGSLVALNRLYGVRYGTPKKPIEDALSTNSVPLLDWPVHRVSELRRAFPGRVRSIYLEAPSLDELKRRLQGREGADGRFAAAQLEHDALHRGEFEGLIDHRVLCRTGASGEVVESVRGIALRGTEGRD